MKIPFTQTSQSVTLFFKGESPKTVDASHKNFAVLVKKLNSGNHVVEELKALASLATAVAQYVKSAFTTDVTVSGGVVFYKGEPASGFIADKIIEFMSEGRDVQPLMAFFSRIQANPSRRAIEELYKFLLHKNMPLTPDGNFLAYKGVQSDYYSKTGNLTVKVLKGKVNERGQIYNGLGEEIEVARNNVCDNYGQGCAEGLHAGSFDYASSFKGSDGRLLMVEIDPADVVSVPQDCNHQKLRTCRYVVVEELDAQNPKPLTESVKATSNSKNPLRDDLGRFKANRGPKRDANGRFAKKS
jgi:hypothetical protein